MKLLATKSFIISHRIIYKLIDAGELDIAFALLEALTPNAQQLLHEKEGGKGKGKEKAGSPVKGADKATQQLISTMEEALAKSPHTDRLFWNSYCDNKTILHLLVSEKVPIEYLQRLMTLAN